MDKPLWKFTDDNGTFVSEEADKIRSLYFPLCNTHPFMSSITPDLHGDIKSGFNSFLLEPVSRLDLTNSKSSRNFWIYINPKKIWSLTGISKDFSALKKDKFCLEAGMLWQKATRTNRTIGLSAAITSFVPSNNDPLEIMLVELRNITNKTINFVPTAAIPLYARSCSNLHDHRHVTSLLQRIELTNHGVIAKPTLLFDERGHHKNYDSYFVLGFDQNANPPKHIYPTQDIFTGNGDLESPQAVTENLSPDKNLAIQGKESFGGIKFASKKLLPGETATYIILMGITKDRREISTLAKKYNSPQKIKLSLENTKHHWQNISNRIRVETADKNFDHWFKWVNIQPALRKIYGCSFLPDFDYGKGGRGWRDLWQDCLALILSHPDKARLILLNNFRGVRVDGSNATIIGTKSGEFIADRNNISRVWMDHGVWPFFTTDLYIQQTADFNILFEKASYFCDPHIWRNRKKNHNWTPESGKELKTKNNRIYKGTILEHILVQNLTQFFNVGKHNLVRLEDADWNDGLDMAGKHGESVAFSAKYCHNLKSIAELLENIPDEKFVFFKELGVLFDTISSSPINYNNNNAKNKLLYKYFALTEGRISGDTITLYKQEIIKDLKRKSDWLLNKIRKSEWLKEGFFNGYYDDDGKRVEGRAENTLRMTLTGQVFPIMSGIADANQVKAIFLNACRSLQNKKLKGFHLNTNFKEEQPKLGRAFSFIYGDKENGAFFNHMNVMFSYALYKRGFVNEGAQVLNSIFRMSLDSKTNQTYPCLPEYFDAEGRGMYSYLTGSASWLLFTVLTQVFGLRGEYGNLVLEPKLNKEEFNKNKEARISSFFANKPLSVIYRNPKLKNFSEYCLSSVRLNEKNIGVTGDRLQVTKKIIINRKQFLSLSNNSNNILEVILD